jgi:hypothetical protein
VWWCGVGLCGVMLSEVRGRGAAPPVWVGGGVLGEARGRGGAAHLAVPPPSCFIQAGLRWGIVVAVASAVAGVPLGRVSAATCGIEPTSQGDHKAGVRVVAGVYTLTPLPYPTLGEAAGETAAEPAAAPLAPSPWARPARISRVAVSRWLAKRDAIDVFDASRSPTPPHPIKHNVFGAGQGSGPCEQGVRAGGGAMEGARSRGQGLTPAQLGRVDGWVGWVGG